MKLLFAPGAGLPSGSSWMQTWAQHLAELGSVHAFDHPYQVAGRKRPDRMPVLVAHAREQLPVPADDAVVFAGKSMGSRVGCHLSLEVPLSAVVCFGYPLAGGGDRTKLRDEVLISMTTPVLFIQGTPRQAVPP